MTEAATTDWFTVRVTDGEDHHAALARRRADAPVERLSPFGDRDPDLAVHVVYRYDDVRRVLTDDATFSLDIARLRYGAVLGRRALPGLSGSDQRRHRHLLYDAFGPARRHHLRETVVGPVVDAVLDELPRGEPVDLVATVAARVPALVLTRLLGLPDTDAGGVLRLATAVSGFADAPRDAIRAARTLRRRFTAALDEGEDAGGDGLLRAFARLRGSELTDDDIASLLIVLAWAGTETAYPAIATSLHVALTRPDALAAVRERPTEAAAVVAECLRWEAPVQLTARRAVTATSLGDVDIPAGAVVLLHLGSANRDERRFDRADVFDPQRADSDAHLSFGLGPHRCVGAALASAELETCLQRFAQRFPDARLVGEAPIQGQLTRRPASLTTVLP